MHLKSLVLKGFKSFADKTELTFEPGLTVIVGPNGSGKSNVSDAILWVLGEQSAKHLRGQTMEDVIFAGSSARKAVSVAEVDLVLDNSDHMLPVEFSEVAITRRMYRSGESEYLINGSPARLMDIQDILHDSGLGKDTHSIISQGKLDGILASKPEERRVLIEEAAGISKHKKRKERSMRKLASMDESLDRARERERSLKRRIGPLERQVDKAKQYDELHTELRELKIDLSVDDLVQLKETWTQVSKVERERLAELDVAQFEQEQRAQELEKLQVLLEEKGLFVGDLAEQRRRMQSLMERMESNLRLLEEKGRNMVDRLSSTRSTMYRAQTTLDDALKEYEQLQDELMASRAQAAVLQTDLAYSEQQALESRSSRSNHDEQLSSLEHELRDARRTLDEVRVEHSQAMIALSDFESQNLIFEERISRIEEDLDQRKQAVATAEKNAAEHAAGLTKAEAAVEEAEREVETLRTARTEASERELEASKRYEKSYARLQILESLREETSEENPIQARVRETYVQQGWLAGQVAEILRVPKEYEDLVERLLAQSLDGLVLSNQATLNDAIEHAMRHKDQSGVVQLWTQHVQNAPSRHAIPGRLLDIISVADEYKAIVEELLGDVYLRDDISSAQKLVQTHDHIRVVTQDGITLSSNGFVSIEGKTSNSTRTHKGILSRERERQELRAELPTLETRKNSAAESLEQLNKNLELHQTKIVEAQKIVTSTKSTFESLQRELGALGSAVSSLETEKMQVSAEQEKKMTAARDARPKVEKLEHSIHSSEQLIKELEEKLVFLRAARDEARTKERQSDEALSEARLALAMVEERESHFTNRVEILDREIARAKQIIDETSRTARSLEAKSFRVEPLHKRFTDLSEAAKVWAHRLRDQVSLEEAGSDSLKDSVGNARTALEQARGKVARAHGAIGDLKVEKGKLDVQVEAAVRAITATGIVLETALARPALQDREAGEKRRAKLERELESIGPVNQVALEEYEQVKAEHDDIAEQLHDLEAAHKAITKIISAIDRKMRTRFIETFETVDSNFQEIFQILFPGGSAHLEFTLPDDPAQTGIEVVAQPKGKRISKMTLMSGGEKSLTALALLFAVYRTRTVPFYVLDEVEAALDDSNLDRLLGAVAALREKTQLIIISHQRRTMEQADVLYGVSMQADGVSKMVSQKLESATL